MLKMLLFIICEPPPKIQPILKPFLAIFNLFHLKNWPYLQKPEFVNLAKTKFWLLLVNNSLCSIPLSWARSEIKEIPGDRCDPNPPHQMRNSRLCPSWRVRRILCNCTSAPSVCFSFMLAPSTVSKNLSSSSCECEVGIFVLRIISVKHSYYCL